MELKVDKAIEQVTHMASSPSADPLTSNSMRRCSQDLQVLRNAARMTRNSLKNMHINSYGAVSAGGDVEAGVGVAEQELARMRQSIAQVRSC